MTSLLGSAVLGSAVLGSSASEASDPTQQDLPQSLGLVATATYVPIVNVIAANTLGLTAAADTNFIAVAAANTLGLGAIVGYHQQVDIIQYLGFSTRVFVSSANTLGMTAKANEAVNADAMNAILTQGPKVVRAHVAANALGLTNTALATQLADASNELGLTQVIDTNDMQFNLGITQGVLKQHVSYKIYKSRACLDQKYAPLIGSSDSNEFADVPASGPTLTVGDTLTLSYPFDTPTLTIQLRNPEFQNNMVKTYTKLDRNTRGKDRKIFSDPKWASWERLQLPVTNVCPETDGDIITFLNATIGKQIRLADWEGRDWKGFIVNPETDVTSQPSGFAVQLTFEGVVVP